MKRFQREAHAVAILNHPGIAAVYDSGRAHRPRQWPRRPVLGDGAGGGPTLRDVLRGEGPLPAGPSARAIAAVVLDALGHSHAAGIVHRDIKPSNIMITPTAGQGDGLRHRPGADRDHLRADRNGDGDRHRQLPVPGAGPGCTGSTCAATSTRPGACCTSCCSAGRRSSGDSSVSVAYQHVREIATPPSQLDPGLSPDSTRWSLKALAKDPDDALPVRGGDGCRCHAGPGRSAGRRGAGRGADGGTSSDRAVGRCRCHDGCGRAGGRLGPD